MKLQQIPVVAGGLAAAILAAGGVTAMTYSASAPFGDDGSPAFVRTAPVAAATRGIARSEHRSEVRHHGRHHRRHQGEDHAHGRHHGRHHGRGAEAGDDRGGRGAEPGDDHGSGGHGRDD